MAWRRGTVVEEDNVSDQRDVVAASTAVVDVLKEEDYQQMF